MSCEQEQLDEKDDEAESKTWEKEQAARDAEYKAQRAKYDARPDVIFNQAKNLKTDEKPSATVVAGDVVCAPEHHNYSSEFNNIHCATFSYQRGKFICGVSENRWQPRVREDDKGNIVTHHTFKKTQEWVRRVMEMKIIL